MKEYYFHTKDLTVGYNGKPLIKDISVRLKKGEILTLIGPNGSGKSTILKSITKHLRTIGGDSFIDGASVEKMSFKEMSTKVAVVLTERLRPEMMTCRDLVATGRYPYTGSLGLLTDEDERAVDDALGKVHAAEIQDRDFTEISDGQKQRILLARAICQDPDIIVLDEPTSFLDIKHKLELLNILRTMAKEKGITVIMSLHEIDLAQKISDKVMCVRGEHITSFGTPEEIFREDVIKELYDITNGSYNITFGSVELPKPALKRAGGLTYSTGAGGALGEALSPDVFVISSCGSGINVYRQLQKDGIPFYAGILYTNDVDYAVAKSLAEEVFEEAPFMPVSDGVYERAVCALRKCRRVIDAGVFIGQSNERVKDLLRLADELGILERRQAKA